ncbi:MAG: hypothetical protein R3199_01340 [Gemmatimonadota bacterium]|nr:hypothetical protein [Gemmatimonadota bacterium]
MEILMALAVTGILALVALPSLSDSLDPYEAVSEARTVHSRLVEARGRAVAEQRPVRVAFEAGSIYRMAYWSAGAWHTIGGVDTVAPGVSLSINGSSDGVVRFASHGRPDEVATIVLDDGDHDQQIQVLASGMALWSANP